MKRAAPDGDDFHLDLRTIARFLPRHLLGVGTRDLFYVEDLAYAERLTAADVPCHVEIVQGAFHSFDMVRPKAAVSQSFFASQCASLREAFAA